MIASPKNFIEQFQNFIEHIAGLMKTFLTKEVADNYYLGKTDKAVSAGTADTASSATKATQDANGNVIPKTYATKSELTSGLATKQPIGDYRTKSELDSIYLGINAKAKSAITADTAISVDNVTWESINDKPTLFNGWAAFSSQVEVYVNKNVEWTAPNYGLLCISSGGIGINGNYFGYATHIPMKKGQKAKKETDILRGTFIIVS